MWWAERLVRWCVVYTDSSVGSSQPTIPYALVIILSTFFAVRFDVFLYHTVIDSDRMLWIIAVWKLKRWPLSGCVFFWSCLIKSLLDFHCLIIGLDDPFQQGWAGSRSETCRAGSLTARSLISVTCVGGIYAAAKFTDSNSSGGSMVRAEKSICYTSGHWSWSKYCFLWIFGWEPPTCRLAIMWSQWGYTTESANHPTMSLSGKLRGISKRPDWVGSAAGVHQTCSWMIGCLWATELVTVVWSDSCVCLYLSR